MDEDERGVVADACPFGIIWESKWGKRFNEKCGLDGIKGAFFHGIMNERKNCPKGFGQGLYGVSVQTQHESLTLLENGRYMLDYTDPESKISERVPVVVKTINIHRDNRVAWVWLQ